MQYIDTENIKKLGFKNIVNGGCLFHIFLAGLKFFPVSQTSLAPPLFGFIF